MTIQLRQKNALFVCRSQACINEEECQSFGQHFNTDRKYKIAIEANSTIQSVPIREVGKIRRQQTHDRHLKLNMVVLRRKICINYEYKSLKTAFNQTCFSKYSNKATTLAYQIILDISKLSPAFALYFHEIARGTLRTYLKIIKIDNKMMKHFHHPHPKL